MANSVTLSGFPNVVRARVLQGSGATPGRIVIDTAVKAGASTEVPNTSSLTIQYGSSTFTWSDIRVVRSPRVRKGYMRTVFEDSRWKLRTVRMPGAWNRRDSAGVLLGDSAKTLMELCGLLSTAANITIDVGSNAPTVVPPAAWNGRSADQCLGDLIRDCVGRLIYNPLTGYYELHGAGLGSLPTSTNRFYRPAPDREIQTLKVHSYPILYESRLTGVAVYDDGEGEMISVSSPEHYFTNFVNIEDPIKRERCRQSAFRLWRISGEDRVILPHRALSVISGAGERVHVSSRIIRSPYAEIMNESHLFSVSPDIRVVQRDDGGVVFATENPCLIGEGSSLATSAQILTGFHKIVSGKLETKTQDRSVGASGGVLELTVPWIQPFDSDEPDMPESEWDDLHSDVADALAAKYNTNPQNVLLPGLQTFTTSGHIGRVEYVFTLWPRANAVTRIAVGFDPAVESSII